MYMNLEKYNAKIYNEIIHMFSVFNHDIFSSSFESDY